MTTNLLFNFLPSEYDEYYINTLKKLNINTVSIKKR